MRAQVIYNIVIFEAFIDILPTAFAFQWNFFNFLFYSLYCKIARSFSPAFFTAEECSKRAPSQNLVNLTPLLNPTLPPYSPLKTQNVNLFESHLIDADSVK